METNLLLYKRSGMRVYLHWTFLALTMLVIIANAWPGNIDRIAWAGIVLIILAISVLLHECAHVLTAAALGIRAKEVVLLPVGGVVGVQRFPDNAVKELVINLAGPLFSLLLAFIASRLLHLHTSFWDMHIPYGEGDKNYLLFTFFLVNLFIGSFNLIPAFPMDGGRILRGILALRWNYIRATNFVHTLGFLIVILLIILSVLLKSFLPALIAVFIMLVSSTEQSYAVIRSLVYGLTAHDVASENYYTLPASMTISDARKLLSTNENAFFVLENAGFPAGVIKRLSIIVAYTENHGHWLLSSIPNKMTDFFDAKKPLTECLETLAHYPDKIFAVIDNDLKLKGVISFPILMEYLLLHRKHSKLYPAARSLALLNQ